MQHMLIGSKALEFWKAPEVEVRKSDWDIITDSNDFGKFYNGQRIETFSLNELNNEEMMQFGLDMNVKINDIPVLICNPTGLAIIKRSHLHRPWFFKKHISMFHNYKLRSGNNLSKITKSIEQDSDLMTILKNRTSLTKLAYGDKTPSLKMSNDDFFDNAVQHFTVHHDLIHEQVAYEDRPMYEHLKESENLNDAWCSKDLWQKLTHDQKIKMVQEESMAIALERWVCPLKAGLIRTDLPIVPKVYFLQALEKICTTLCSGYFRDFAIENWKETHESFDQKKMMNFFESQLWISYINEKRNMDDTPNTLRNDSN